MSAVGHAWLRHLDTAQGRVNASATTRIVGGHEEPRNRQAGHSGQTDRYRSGNPALWMARTCARRPHTHWRLVTVRWHHDMAADVLVPLIVFMTPVALYFAKHYFPGSKKTARSYGRQRRQHYRKPAQPSQHASKS